MDWMKNIMQKKTMQANQQQTDELIEKIVTALRLQITNNVINYEQLNKIHNLATNPTKLKKALDWL